MRSIFRLWNTPVSTATPPAKTGFRSGGRPASSSASTRFARSRASRSSRSPSGVTSPFVQPFCRRTSPTAVIVPDAPKASTHPALRSGRFALRSCRSAAITASSNRRGVSLPSSKNRSEWETHPMRREWETLASNPSPTITSVLPPPMSTASRRPDGLGDVCATPR